MHLKQRRGFPCSGELAQGIPDKTCLLTINTQNQVADAKTCARGNAARHNACHVGAGASQNRFGTGVFKICHLLKGVIDTGIGSFGQADFGVVCSLSFFCLITLTCSCFAFCCRGKIAQIDHGRCCAVNSLVEAVLRKDRVKRKEHKQQGQGAQALHGEVKSRLNLLIMAFGRRCFRFRCAGLRIRFGLDEF
ncbi:MAG: hypothetical protein EBX55_05535 [Betaproteobacteria bacterium]|nr:hypothetical protein [Betaproteobacteria bacterium]NDC70982.1 hypothetical protein [Betaproteobacteria bacterium]NDG57923.1 hypothetical protein [Betaproteobacteria bacterium]